MVRDHAGGQVLASLDPHPLSKRLSVHRHVDTVVTGAYERRLLSPAEAAPSTPAAAAIRIQQPEKRSGVQSSGSSETAARAATAATHPLTRPLHELTAIATPAETATSTASTTKRIERTALRL